MLNIMCTLFFLHSGFLESTGSQPQPIIIMAQTSALYWHHLVLAHFVPYSSFLITWAGHLQSGLTGSQQDSMQVILGHSVVAGFEPTFSRIQLQHTNHSAASKRPIMSDVFASNSIASCFSTWPQFHCSTWPSVCPDKFFLCYTASIFYFSIGLSNGVSSHSPLFLPSPTFLCFASKVSNDNYFIMMSNYSLSAFHLVDSFPDWQIHTRPPFYKIIKPY